MDQTDTVAHSASATPAIVAQEIRDLPLSIRVLPKLKRLLQDGSSCMDTIISMLRLDPGLATRVLRMANSAFFSGCYRCQTLEDAVPRIGYQQIYETVAYAVASEVLIHPVPTYRLEADHLWYRSVTCALAADILATRCGADRDEAYTVGLLHNVGVVAMDAWLVRHRPDASFAYECFPREWTTAERQELGFTHADVGATLLTHWEFPLSIGMPVQWQYSPQATHIHQQMATILYAARWVRSKICDENSDSLAVPDNAVLRPAGIEADALPCLIAEVQTALSKVSELLQTDEMSFSALPFPARA